MKASVKPGPLQKLRVAAITNTNPRITMGSTGSPAAISGALFVNYGRDAGGQPSPFRGSLKDQILTGADASYAAMAGFALQDGQGFKIGAAATYAAGGAGDNVVISLNGGANQTVDTSTTLAGQYSYLNALNAGLVGITAQNSNGQIKLSTTATGAAANANIVSLGGAAAAKTGLSTGLFTPGVMAQPQGTGADLNTLTLEGPPWSPLSLTALFAWWDSKNFQLDKAGNVQRWLDRGPNGYDAIQTVASARPAHGLSPRRGVEYLNLNGQHSLVVPNSPAKAQPVEVFVICRSTAVSAGGSSLFDTGAGLQANILQQFGTRNITIYSGASLVGSSMTIADHIVDAQYNGGASNIAIDGAAGTTGAAGAAGIGATMTIGNKGDGLFGFGFIGRIYEVVVCSALLSASDRLTLIGYLKSKYRIA